MRTPGSGQNKIVSSRLAVALSILAGCYLWILWSCLALRFVFEDQWWWLGFLNSFAPYWFVPLIAVLPVACFTKRRVLQFLSLLSVVAFLLLFGRLLTPKWSPSKPSGPTITVMSYNILGTNQDWPAILASISEADADVIAVQELNREIAERIQTELAEPYRFQILDSQDSLISRYPITLTETSLSGGWGTPPRVYQIDFDGQRVTLVNAHFYASFLNFDVPFMNWVFRERERQAQIIADFAVQVGTPLIVTADFNATDQSRAYRIITNQLVDSWREAGWGLGHTFPGGLSAPSLQRPVILGSPVPMWVVRIDYIFHTGDWIATRARLGRWDGVSDHRPVVVTLELRE